MAAPAQADKNNQVDKKSEEPSSVLVCLYNLYRQFLEVCTLIQGLVAVFLTISGALQLSWMSNLAEDDPQVHHLSTCRQICWMIIISGIFVFLWTVFGWIVYMRGSISLSITSGVSSFIIVVMFYFMYCGSSDHYQDLHPQFKLCFIIILQSLQGLEVLQKMIIILQKHSWRKRIMQNTNFLLVQMCIVVNKVFNKN